MSKNAPPSESKSKQNVIEYINFLNKDRADYRYALLNIIDIMGGDSGSIIGWNISMLERFTPDSLSEAVIQKLSDLDDDSCQRAAYRFKTEIYHCLFLTPEQKAAIEEIDNRLFNSKRVAN